jgi:threonine/homoserine/homoserine lactone efflux protein
MLVYLGVKTLRDAARSNAFGAPPRTQSLLDRGRRPFAVGLMHGLAGSGALAALVALSAPAVSTGLACLTLYAIGTVFGMIGLAAAAGPMLARAGKAPILGSVIVRASGIVSLGVGALWIVRTLAAD